MDEEDMFSDLFSEQDLPGAEDLRMEYVSENWQPYYDVFRPPHPAEYRYDKQLDAFNEKINHALERHDTVYDVTVQKTADEHGRVRYEAWILHEEGDTDA